MTHFNSHNGESLAKLVSCIEPKFITRIFCVRRPVNLLCLSQFSIQNKSRQEFFLSGHFSYVFSFTFETWGKQPILGSATQYQSSENKNYKLLRR